VNSRTVAILTLALLSPAGCAVYQFELIEPRELAQVIDEPVRFAIAPVEYLAVPSRDAARLALRIENITGEPLGLIGERSWLVDPLGESHAVRGATIAPYSHVTLMLPAEPIVVESFRPRFGVGVGMGRFHRRGAFGIGAWNRYPYDDWHAGRRFYVYDPDRAYWRWREGLVRLRFAYEQAGDFHEHDLAFERVRVW
jgi:hypothetical protein